MSDDETTADPSLERIEPETHPNAMMAAEHVARYRWATQFVIGKRVLDAGCGSGYGAAMMSAAGARQVVGIDIDADTIEAARSKMPVGVELAVGDLESVPVGDACFDVVVCLEAIEHVLDPEAVLDEFRRVLIPGGLLVLSTPNRDVVTPGNPYHLHEYTPDELESTVSRRFAKVEVRRQHTWIATAVLDDDSFARGDGGRIPDVEVRKWTGGAGGGELTTLIVAGPTPIDAEHPVLEICSPVELRELDRMFHDQEESIRAYARQIEDVRAERDAARTALGEAEADLAGLRQLVLEICSPVELEELERRFDKQFESIRAQARRNEEIRAERDALRAALVETESDLAHLHQLEEELAEVSQLAGELREIEADRNKLIGVLHETEAVLHETETGWHQRYDLVVNSTSWRVTGPLRRLMDVLRGSSAGHRR